MSRLRAVPDLQAGQRDGQSAAQRGVDDLDLRAEWDGVEEADDIAGFHADTAVTGRTSDAAFFGGAVDVDATSEGACVARFKTAQTQDARDDGIAAARIWTEDFTSAPQAMKDGADRSARPDLGGDLQRAERCGVAARLIAETELRGRDRELGDAEPVLHEGEPLIGDTDQDCGTGLRAGGQGGHADDSNEDTEKTSGC